jgi:hypothetical protein
MNTEIYAKTGAFIKRRSSMYKIVARLTVKTDKIWMNL